MHWVNTAASLLAQQQRAIRHAFCPEGCCIALVSGDCTPYEQQILVGVDAVAQDRCQPVLHNNTEKTKHAFCPEQCCCALVFGNDTPV